MRCGHAPQDSAPRGPWRPSKTLVAALVCIVVSISIIPHAFEEVSRRVAIATVLGFVAGYLLSY